VTHRNVKYDAARRVYRVRKQVKGQRVAKSFPHREDAEDWLRSRDRQAAGLEPLRMPLSLADARDRYLAHLGEIGASPETMRYYAAKFTALVTVLGAGCDLAQLDDARISAYLGARRDKSGDKKARSNRTLRAELALLARISRLSKIRPLWDMPKLIVTMNPRRYVAPDELARLWSALEQGEPAQVALGLCALGGLRASEAYRATAADVDRVNATLTLGGPRRKTGHPHTIPLVPLLLGLAPRHGALVAAKPVQVSWRLERLSRTLGIPSWTGPGLGRHSFASWAVRFGGFTGSQVADALGHARPGAIRYYIHAEGVETLMRPMALRVESVLLHALNGLADDAAVLPFRADGPA
jgi:integrase